MRKLIASIFAVFIIVCSNAIAFDSTRGNFKEFGGTDGLDYYGRHRNPPAINLDGAICSIKVIAVAEGLYPDYDNVTGKLKYKRGSGIVQQAGHAFHIGQGNFVTAAHVIEPSLVEIQVAKHVYYQVPVDKVTSIVITLGNDSLGQAPANLVWKDSTQDLAIVSLAGKWAILSHMNYDLVFTKTFVPMGFSGVIIDELSPGTAVAMITRVRVDPSAGNYSFGFTYEIRYGTVVHNKPVCPAGADPSMVAWFQLGDVTTDIIVYPGDSGSPVFAFKDGVPVLVGVARAFAYGLTEDSEGRLVVNYYSYFSRIDSITRKWLEEK